MAPRVTRRTTTERPSGSGRDAVVDGAMPAGESLSASDVANPKSPSGSALSDGARRLESSVVMCNCEHEPPQVFDPMLEATRQFDHPPDLVVDVLVVPDRHGLPGEPAPDDGQRRVPVGRRPVGELHLGSAVDTGNHDGTALIRPGRRRPWDTSSTCC